MARDGVIVPEFGRQLREGVAGRLPRTSISAPPFRMSKEAELDDLVHSDAATASLAENYVGLPGRGDASLVIVSMTCRWRSISRKIA